MPVRWWWRVGLRSRLMAIGMAGLAVALIVSGFALYFGLRWAIQRNIDTQARIDADQVSALINGNALPDPVPVSGALVIQVLDQQRRVVAGSAAADRLAPLLTEEELARAEQSAITVSGSRIGVTESLRVVAEHAGTAVAPRTVVVAVSAGNAEHAAALVRDAVLILFPILLTVLAVIAWRVIGRALQPVEAIRSAAARISGADTGERLPVGPAQDEIASLAVTLNDMLASLRESREQQRAFVADAAHELRSPLASLQLQLEVAESGADPRACSDIAAEALIDVHRLSTLVEDLLLLAKSDAGDVPIRWEQIELRTLVTGIIERAAPNAHIQLVPGPPVAFRTDPDKFGRAVGNVLDNAVRHANSTVIVEIASRDGTINVSVEDDGAGIPDQDRDRVLQRFTRLRPARERDSGGAGLGLPIAVSLIRQLGGTLTLPAGQSTPGSGHPGLRVEICCPLLPSTQASQSDPA